MNVIFLDFDGVLNTIHFNSDDDVEKRVRILAEICHEYDCKVVIEAAAKDVIDEETFEIKGRWVNYVFSLFEKYGIKCIGRTPNVKKYYTNSSYMSMWKEDEIRLYLFRHPEIAHYCVIDDDALAPYNSDLNKVRDHLVKTIYCSENALEEGLLLEHKDEVGKVLQKENEVRRLLFRKNRK